MTFKEDRATVSDKRPDTVQTETTPSDADILSDKPVRLIGYARCSTADQNIDLQVNALKTAGCTKIYSDAGVSGSLAKRPALDRALKALHPGDTLMVWKLDRLGRSLGHLITTIADLGARGISFRSLTDPIDTSSSAGRLMLHIMGALAEFERNLIVERTRAGLTAARARGTKLGPKFLLDAEKIVHARELLKTESGRAVARTLGCSRSTLYASLGR